jgi:hypothetical protein
VQLLGLEVGSTTVVVVLVVLVVLVVVVVYMSISHLFRCSCLEGSVIDMSTYH